MIEFLNTFTEERIGLYSLAESAATEDHSTSNKLFCPILAFRHMANSAITDFLARKQIETNYLAGKKKHARE